MGRTIPDYLIVNADTFLLFTTPLKALPEKVKIARELLDDWHTGCWRGYVAYWQLVDNKLYLTNILSCSNTDKRMILLWELFGNQCREGKVFAEWVTDELVCPTGKLLKSYNEGYRSIYEYETVYQVRKGLLSNQATFNNRKTKISVYESDPEKFKKFIYSHIAWNNLPVLPADSVVRVFVRIKSNPEGEKPTIDLLKGAGQGWDAEAIRVLGLLSEWSVDYVRGQLQLTAYYVPVIFSEATRKRYEKVR